MAFYIVTDATCDLQKSYTDKQENMIVIPMPYRMDGEERMFTPFEHDEMHEFYQALRDGKVATTAQVSLADYQALFTKLVKAGHEVLYICFSSGGSGSFQTALLARSLVLEENPNAKLYVIDSLSFSVGQGLLVHYALQKRAEGMNAEQVAQWVQENRQHIAHWFTVDDLDFLYRGGRLSKSSAFLGGMLRIKPILNVGFDGKLMARDKVMGRKSSLKELAKKYQEFATPQVGQPIWIGHGDCLDDAQYVADSIKKLVPDAGPISIMPISAIIGAHTGPGVVALFFLCEQR